MKQTFLVILTAFALAPLAQAVECFQKVDPRELRSFIYKVDVSESRQSAQLIKDSTNNGKELLETLPCANISIRRLGNRGINPRDLVLSCRTPGFDHGYIFSLFHFPIGDRYEATLSKITIAGTTKIAELGCKK